MLKYVTVVLLLLLSFSRHAESTDDFSEPVLCQTDEQKFKQDLLNHPGLSGAGSPLGTPWNFRYIEQIDANAVICKIPPSNFNRFVIGQLWKEHYPAMDKVLKGYLEGRIDLIPEFWAGRSAVLKKSGYPDNSLLSADEIVWNHPIFKVLYQSSDSYELRTAVVKLNVAFFSNKHVKIRDVSAMLIPELHTLSTDLQPFSQKTPGRILFPGGDSSAYWVMFKVLSFKKYGKYWNQHARNISHSKIKRFWLEYMTDKRNVKLGFNRRPADIIYPITSKVEKQGSQKERKVNINSLSPFLKSLKSLRNYKKLEDGTRVKFSDKQVLDAILELMEQKAHRKLFVFE